MHTENIQILTMVWRNYAINTRVTLFPIYNYHSEAFDFIFVREFTDT